MIGTIILAAGLGKRLGRGVKALIKFDEEVLLARLLRKSGDKVIVLTSKETHYPIVNFLKENNITHAKAVEMPVMQSYTNPEQCFPIGNGAVFKTVATSKAYKDWLEVGVTRVSVIPIDNPLAEPLDKDMVGGDLVIKAIENISPDENLGSVVLEGNKLSVIEYYELTKEEKEMQKLGYTGMFVCTIDFFKNASNIDLPWHEVVRKGVAHKEKLLIDAFPIAKNPNVVVQRRDTSFCPIKIESDIALAEKLLYNRRKLKINKG